VVLMSTKYLIINSFV